MGSGEAQYAERMIKLHGPGLVTMSECEVCGWRNWASSRRTEPDGTPIPDQVVIEPMETWDGIRCPRCVQAHARGPEVVEWMCGVIAKSQRDTRVVLLDLLYEEKLNFLRDGVHEPPPGYAERKARNEAG